MAIITNSEDNNIDIESDNRVIEHVFLLPNLNLRPDQVAKKELKVDGRRAVYEMLLMRSCNGKLKKTHTKEIAALFGVGVRTIQRVWKKAMESGNNDYKSGRGNGEKFAYRRSNVWLLLSLSVILSYYKDGDTKKGVVYRRHVVDRIQRKLHQQVVNVDVINVDSVHAEVYSSVATAVIWGMRLALAIGLYYWIFVYLLLWIHVRWIRVT